MEDNNILRDKRIRTLSNDPQYFGGYLNMARLNIFNISNHIANEFKQAVLGEDGEIKNSFLCNKTIKRLNWNHVYSKTNRFLSILKVFDVETLPKEERENSIAEGRNFANMSDTLKVIFGELQEFRNDYSHYYSTDKADSRKIIIKPELALFLTTNFKRAIAYTKVRMKDVLCEDDYQLVEKIQLIKSENQITTEGLVFLICMFLEREHAFQFIGKIQGLKGTQFKSFIATREVLMSFCIRLPHDKFVSEDIKQSLTLDMINDLNRCPKALYDVITEPKKQQFRPELDNEKIIHLIENSINQANVEEVLENIDYEQYIELLTKRVRHNNRFSYFAMRYIDENNVFDKLRFHIDLGKYQLDKYTKLLNNESTDRIVIERAKAFGKLSDFSNQEIIENKIDKNSLTDGFEQFAPHYNDDNNKIGLSNKDGIAILSPKSDKNKKVANKLHQPLPQAFLSLNELPKIILMEHLEHGSTEKIINDFLLLSNDKVMNIEFIEVVKAKLPTDWNEFTKRTDSKKKKAYSDAALQYLWQRKSILNNELEQYHLNDKQIPTKILNYWLNIKEVDEIRSVSERIKLMKRDCMSRLKTLEKHKMDAKVKTPKIGEMATFLAKDIVDMIVSKDKKQEITSFYYDKMQECLALYADTEKKALFIHIISNELKLYEQGGHPFLLNIDLNRIRKTSELYEEYLREKGNKQIKKFNPRTQKTTQVDVSWMMKSFYTKEWNEEIKKQLTVVKLPVDKSNIPYTIRLWEEKEKYDLKAWLHNVTVGKQKSDKRKAVDLPTNLFDNRICDLLREKLNTMSVDYNPASNYNELLKKWWETRDDSTQDFYNAEREYTIYEQIVNYKLNTAAHFADYYKTALGLAFNQQNTKREIERRTNRRLPKIEHKQVERVFKNTIAGTEKEIRILQEEDRMVLLMLEKLMDGSKNLKLNKIDVLLNETTAIEEPITAKLSFGANGEELKDKAEITKTIVAERKQKNYTELRKYRHDRRLPELFEYFDSNKIKLEDLQLELSDYNQAKQQVFDIVFELEQALIQSDKEAVIQFNIDQNGQPVAGNIAHKPYLKLLLKRGLISEDEMLFLKMVRNCFSHNQFPQRATMNKLIDVWVDSKYATQIVTKYNEIISTIIVRL